MPGHVASFRDADRVLISGDAVVTGNLDSPWDPFRRSHEVSGPPYIPSWSRSTPKASVAAA